MKKTISLTESPIRRTLIKLSAPLVWGMVLTKLSGVVEMYFIGKMGTAMLAANSYLFPVFSGFISLCYGVSVGATTIAAQALGAKDEHRASGCTMSLLILLSTLGGIFCIICITALPHILLLQGADPSLEEYIRSYILWACIGIMPLAWTIAIGSAFRASGHMNQPAIAIAISAISGAVMAAILIPDYGLAGAGAASSISYLASFVYIVAAWLRQPPMKLTWHDRIKTSSIMKIGLPVAASNAIVPFAFSVMLGMASQFGNHSIAALGITGRIETFALILISAMCSALMPVISQNHGANAKERTQAAIKTGFIASMAIGIMLGGVLFVFANDIAAIFSKDAEVQAMSSSFIKLLPLSYWAVGIFMVVLASLNALGKTTHGLIINAVRWVAITLPLAWLMSPDGAYSIVQANFIANIIACVLGAMWLRWVYNK